MKKHIKKTIFIIAFLLVLLGIAIFISLSKFNVENPFSVVTGLYKITFTDTEYVKIQEYPKVIIAKPNNANDLLNKYMESEGYYEKDRLGAIIEFAQAESVNYVEFSVNKYYSLWEWNEWRQESYKSKLVKLIKLNI